jgi:hypothetical protein
VTADCELYCADPPDRPDPMYGALVLTKDYVSSVDGVTITGIFTSTEVWWWLRKHPPWRYHLISGEK